jgi:hypothetical protein
VAKMDARDSLFAALTPIITSFERVAAIFSKNLTHFCMSKKGVFMSQWICRFSLYIESANGQYSPTPSRWTARTGAAGQQQGGAQTAESMRVLGPALGQSAPLTGNHRSRRDPSHHSTPSTARWSLCLPALTTRRRACFWTWLVGSTSRRRYRAGR